MSSPVSYLDPVQLRRDLGLRDLSDPADGPHAIQILISQAVEGLCRAWGCEIRWGRGPRIVPVTDNYDRLGYPAEAITRETRYTRYVDAGHMLRSHSSAMIPRALRLLARRPGDDVLLACPGIVYRRDAIDWQHTGTPHQLDLWRITRRAMSSTDMDQMIAILLGALAPGLPHRQRPRTHPYTLDGRQVDVYHDGRWVEVWECGLAHPGVLAAAGLPGRDGLALGMGLDRLLMLVKHIPDIRLLRCDDPRITGQMLDLARYQAVSSMPPVTRDLSVAVPDDDDDETLGDRVRDALGADTACVEEVRVLAASAYEQLPASAIGRLGAKPGQKNLLVRIVLRDLDKTLTNETANALRDRIYRALHQGTEYQWAANDPSLAMLGTMTTEQPWSWPETMDAPLAAPASHRVLLENDRVRVLEVVIEPRTREPEHTHRATSVMIVDEPARIRYYVGRALQFESPEHAGAPPAVRVSWMEPEGPHSVENIDERRYHAIRIELK